MKKVTKSFVAILALIAMLTQNAFGVYAQATAPEPIQVENEYISENAEPTVEVTTEETPVDTSESNEGDLTEPVDAALDVENLPPTDDVNYDDQIMLIDDTAEVPEEGTDVVVEEPVTEEVIEEEIPEQLDIYDNQISGAGLSELEIFINTEQLVTGDSFRILFSGPDSAQYDTRLNDYLDTTSHGLYRFLDLNNEGFNIRATSDDNVTFEFASEDGRPVIKVISVESDADKLLFTKTIEDKNGKPVTAIKGEGLKDVSIKVNSEKLTDNAKYTVYVDTEAEVVMNGSTTESISGTKSLESIELSNLNKKSFIVYIVGNEGFEVDSDASVIDVIEGKAEFTLKSVATKTVYEYEDANVYVKAILQKVDAIPDDAYFCVELVKDYEAEEYIGLMNKESGEEDKYTEDNTLVYDISFYTDETKSEVIEPEEGSVTVSIEFKKKQISEELGADSESEVEITHFEENGNSVEPVVLEDASIDAESDEVEFTVDSFSKFAISLNGNWSEVDVKNPGSETTKGLLGNDSWIYGVVANEWTQTEAETSFAVKKINASQQTGTNSSKAVGSNHQYCMVSSVNGELHIKGFDADLTTTKTAKSKIIHTDGNNHLTVYEDSETNIHSRIDAMINVAQNTANRIVQLDSIGDDEDYKKLPSGSNGHLYIDITKAGSGTYYINLDKWPTLKSKLAETGQVHFKKKTDQKIVIYSQDSNVTIRKYDVANGGDNYEDSNTIANHSTYDNPVIEDIIFVVPGESNVTLDGVAGIFIMPQATVTLGNTSGGWLVCDNFTNGAGEWHFTNGHLPSPTDASAELDMIITKELIGGTWPANGFKFEIKRHFPSDNEDSSNMDARNSYENSPLPDNTVITINGNGSNIQSASFGKIKFNASDIWVEESGKVAANGIISKDATWYWKDQKEHNTYDKVMNQVYMYEITEISDNRDPSIVYDTKPWYLKINVNVAKEVDGNGNSRLVIWYDAKTDRSVLPVSQREDKKLECMDIGDQPVRFVNTTNPSVVLEGEKTINGNGANIADGLFAFTLKTYTGSNKFDKVKQTVYNKGNKFTFDEITLDYNGCTTYCDENGNVLNSKYQDNALRENAAYGYQYFLIEETKCDAPYMVQDKYLARVKVAKKYATEAGKQVFKGYQTSVEYFKYGAKASTDINNLNGGLSVMNFDNKYEATGSIEFYAKKIFSNLTLKANDFSFTLYKRADGVDTPIQTVKNDAEGNVHFTKTQNFKLEDVGKTFTYVIKEDKGNIAGVTYDGHEEVITVSVSDNGNGTLNVTADKAMINSPVQFSNVYNADGGIVLSATKAFAPGAKMPSGREFTFVLKEGETELDRKSVTGAGSVAFETIKYALTPGQGEYAIGEHTYTIEEVRPVGATAKNNYTYQGVIYDPTVYTVKVNVTDTASGKLKTTINGTEQATFGVTFTNDYSSESINTSIEGTKTLVGKDLEEGEFTFVIDAVNDAAKNTADCVIPNASVTNDADGKFVFQNIEFKKAGTYKFKITETPDDVENMTYSDDKYDVEIVVKDDNAGKLYIYSKKVNGAANGEIGFTNTYNGKGEVYLVAKKTLNGRTLENEQFTFELLDKDHNSLGDNYVEKNDAKGDITFKAIKYTLSDLSDGNGGYLATKDFVYYIKEKVETEVGGYTYDKTEKKVTVTVVRNADGSLTATAAYEGGKAEFVNTYSAKGEAQFGGYKTFVGKKFTDRDSGLFYAVLKDENGDEIDTQSINKDGMHNRGKYLFKKIEYTQPGTYKYTVEETGTVKGITNDATKFNVEVSVTDNGDGTLSAVVATDNDARTFVNTYNTPGKAIVQAKKTVDFGKLKDEQFEFKLFDEQNNVVDTKWNDASGNIIFKQLDYKRDQLNKDAAGNPVATTFKYQIRETNAGQKIDGFEYSSLVYNVEVTVTPNDDELTTEVVYKNVSGKEVLAADVVFENKYTANGKVVLQAKKKLTGRDMTTGQFSFELRDEKGDLVCPAVPVSAAKAGVDAVVTFPELSFTQADLNNDNSHEIEGGKYAKYYTIREKIPANVPAGYTYDKAVYNVQVTLKDKGKGVIETDWSAVKAGSEPEKHSILSVVWNSIKELFTGESADKNVAFENKYVAEGKVKFSAHKTLTGATLSARDFSFNISGKKEDGSTVNETIENDEKGTVNFTEITYTKPGTYEYTIKEVVPAKDKQKPGYTYDETEYTATVTVTDDGSGVLKVNTIISGGESSITAESDVATKLNGDEYGLCVPDAVQFVNDYKADDVSITVGGTKTLTGKKLVADEFSFTMVNADSNTKVYEETVKNAADGSFSFPTITYTFADMKNADGTYAVNKTFAYEVTEGTGTEEGVKYSTQKYKVVVEVTNANGKLSTKLLVNDLDKSKTPLQAVNFLNTYNVNGQTSLKVVKVVTGKEKSDKVDDEFTFELYDSSDNLIAERTIKANEEGVFDNLDELKYDLNRLDKQSDGSYKKTFTYKMKEKTGDNAGFTYSDVIYDIQVEVVSSPEGVMTITKNITDKDGISVAEPMAFENPYTAVGSVTIEGTKTLVSKNKLLKGDFQFVIKEGETEVSRVHNGYFMDLVDATSVEITNDSLSADDFALKLHYDQSQIGEHVYTISEVIPESKNAKMVYDKHIATVKVVVTDNGDGTLNCVKTVGDGTANANPSFVNYEVDDDAVQFTAVKSMSGMALADDMFTFTLEDEKGNELQSVTNKGTAVVFDKITYTLADVGKHTYKIRETKGTNKGITYSTEVYTAVVTVTYDDGRLKVSKEIKNSEGTVVNSADSDGMVFENKYESKTKVQFSGEKFLVGFDKKDEAYKGKYSFELIDSSGTVIDSAEVTGAGKFDFGVIEYTQDHYNSIPDHKIYYTVKEKAVDEQSHITYDTTVYHIAVELGYNDDGTLKATVSTTEGVDATHNGLVFTNYTAEGAVPFVGTKTVYGANLKSGDYSFELYKGDTLLETVENKGASFVFTPISYTQKEVGSHTYFIKEKTGSVKGMEYDSTVYKIVVTVADNGDGTLDVTKKTYKNDVEVSSELTYAVPFVNKYEAKGETSLEGRKILENRAIKDSDHFTFKLKDSEGNPIDSVECGIDGTFTFDGDYFKYDQEVLKNAAGSYDESVTKYFTVEEVKGDVAGVEYSDDVYAVAVTITDKHNGELEVKNSVKLTNESAKTGFVGLIDSIKNSIAGSNDALKFTNTYKAQGQWDPEGWKELVGRDLKDGEFEFKIREVDLKNNTVNGHEYVVKNVGNQIKFSSDDVVSKKGDYFLKYTQDDLGPNGKANFIYEFSEVKQETATGIKFDEDIYKILVEVSDNGDGTLNVEVDRDDLLKKLTQKIKDSNLEDKNISENAIFLFKNEYEAYGSLDLIGTKTFDGPEEFLKDFKFTIKETTEGKESYEDTVSCDEKGVITFSKLSYKYKPMERDDRGTHTYEIREVIPADDSKAPGVKYDKRIYKVTVYVDDVGEGKLVPTVTSITSELNGGGQEPYDFFVGSDENRANYFTFENKYEANADLLFKGRKFLKRYEDSKDYITGDELKNFEFALYRVDATKDTLIDYATASADGSFVLGLDDNGDIAFTQKDIGKTYTYKLYEEKRVGDGVLYDENVYEITVAVNAPAAGSDKLKLDVTAIDKSGATVAVTLENDEYLYTASTFDFTNLKPEYTVISGEKHWVGGPADGSRPDEVTIKLYASNVGVGQQVINTAVAKAPDWKYRFDSFENGKKLPAYTTDGQKIVYRVDEVEIPGYLSEKVEVVEGKVFDFYNTYGELLIRKVDAITGATLAGAELVILDSAGTEVDRWVSGTSAHAVDITKVEFDKTYTLREVSAPTGYKVAPDQTFTFKKGETTVVTMRDEKITGSVKLRKLDATTRAALEGAEFALYREDGSRVYASGTAGSYRYSETSSNGRFVVNAAGELEVTDLPYGSYYFTETVAPAGYIRSTDRFSFSVLTDGETVEVVALNAKEVGSVRLRKTNADGSVSLAGAVFELYAKTPTTVSSAIAATIYSDVYYRVGTYTTDASGEIYVGDLPWDDYYFVEVEAPTGYEVNTDVNGDPIAYTFTIGSTATATVSYDLGRITNSTTPPDTPVIPSSGGEVRGERRPTDTGRRSGGVLSGVLGVRAAPKAGVLGERLGPVTGDAFNIFLWTLLLLASIGSIIAVAIANARRKKNAR